MAAYGPFIIAYRNARVHPNRLVYPVLFYFGIQTVKFILLAALMPLLEKAGVAATADFDSE